MTRVPSSSVRIIITGASSGIGKAVARELADCGCRLLLVARRQELLEGLAGSLGSPGQVAVLAGDITHAHTRSAILAHVQDVWQGVDVLINNAGIGSEGPFEELSSDDFRRIFEVNFFAPVDLIRDLLPWLKRSNQEHRRPVARSGNGSRQLTVPMIVNVGSVLGHRAVPWKVAYSASKFALHGFSDALRGELQERGIHLLHLCPSTTESEFFENLLHDGNQLGTKRRGMAPAFVAQRLVHAMAHGRREVILPWTGKLVVWMDRIFPPLSDMLVAFHGRRQREKSLARNRNV
jgi:short-subunit dehydrogenase